MRILHISDTHGFHRQIINFPKADIIIHSGDVSWTGSSSEVVDFIEWFSKLDYRYKIFIGGNHDFSLDGKDWEIIQRFLPDNCFYLYNSGVTIAGVKLWGIPFFISNDLKGDSLEVCAQIPLDTDILITHRPPIGILDSSDCISYGCTDLFEAVSFIRPKYHLFGHIHDSYGIEKSEYTTFINASLVDENYRLVNKPFVFDI